MIRKNIYSRITESIVNAYHDNNLDSAMEDGHEMENMGKKIVAIITADPDQDLDWESEYEPFGREELTADDEAECCEHEGIEHDTCPSCGSDVDGHIVSDDEDEADEYDEVAPVIGGGFESEDEADEYEDMDVKDILVDILQELKGEDSDSEEEGAFETSDENPMFGSSPDDEEDSDDEWEDDEDEDVEGMLSNQDDWASEESDDADDSEEDYDDEEDFETPAEDGVETEDYDGMMTSPENEEEVEIFDSLDNA
jgi:hypothetical protein